MFIEYVCCGGSFRKYGLPWTRRKPRYPATGSTDTRLQPLSGTAQARLSPAKDWQARYARWANAPDPIFVYISAQQRYRDRGAHRALTEREVQRVAAKRLF